MRFSPLILICFLAGWLGAIGLGNLSAQVADPEPPAQKYRRPNLAAEILDLSKLALPQELKDALVMQIGLLVRNFPEEKRVTPLWKARLLSIALRLAPEDRDSIVANGQLARGVLPKPVEAPEAVTLESLSAHFIRIGEFLLNASNDPASPESQLALYLLDTAAFLDPKNRSIHELLKEELQGLKWDSLVLAPERGERMSDEELADLRLARSTVTVLLSANTPPKLQTISTAAVKLPPSERKIALQLVLPEDPSRTLEAQLPAMRSLLRNRAEHWPAGWKIELHPTSAMPVGQPAAVLGMALCLDSMILGNALDPTMVVASGIQFPAGTMKEMGSLETFLANTKAVPAERWVITGEPDWSEIGDFLLLYPERARELIRLQWVVARSFGEAAALLQQNRAPLLQRNLDQAAELLAQARAQGLGIGRQEATRKSIESLLAVAPNLPGIRLLQWVAEKKLPEQLSAKGSLRILRSMGVPMLEAGTKQYPTRTQWADKLNPTPWAVARNKVDRIRPRLHPVTRAYADALTDLGRIYDAVVLYPPASPVGKADVDRKIGEARRKLRDAYREFRRHYPQPPPTPEMPALPPAEEQTDAPLEF
jgi:hypothetical protein